jgi:Tfp pilus tip-associated adhesin PilY1
MLIGDGVKISLKYLLVNCLAVGLTLMGSPHASAVSSCSVGQGEPPFLSFGVKSNLLLLIDNSGSMLDPGYSDITKQCFDETYDNAISYGGYFDNAAWYSYDFAAALAAEEFQNVGSTMPTGCGDGTADYFAQDTSGNKFACLDLDSTAAPVDAFVATGNFMNWLAASKFDIQKKILTGGKYDDVNDQLHMESRGCTGSRFVKQVGLVKVSNSDASYKLALGVRGPQEIFVTWLAATNYGVGDVVVYNNILYEASADPAAGDLPTDTSNWAVYKDTRWYADYVYAANSVVLDVASGQWYWTQSGGTSLAAATDITGDTAITWERYDGTSIDIFTPVVGGFDNSSCEEAMSIIGTLEGNAADGTSDDTTSSLGKLKSATEDCMGFDPGGGNTVETARKSSFNKAMQECWYFNEFGHWQPGGGTVSSMKNACENVYDYMKPGDITPWDSGYVCSGSYSSENDKADYGYVGRCWEPAEGAGVLNCVPRDCGAHALDTKWEEGSGSTKAFFGCRDRVVDATGAAGADGTGELYECTEANLNSCDLPDNSEWTLEQICEGGGDLAVTGWTNDDFYYFNPCTYNTCADNDLLIAACPKPGSDVTYTCSAQSDWTCYDPLGDGNTAADECHIADQSANGDRCVDQAIKDFCNIMSIPEVIDPSDSTGLTGEVWNAPSFLVDSGVMGQLGQPLATMNGRIEQSSVPTGILHSTASDLRIGAMAFNAVGAKTECDAVDTTDVVEQYCPADNKDGALVIAEIKLGSENTGTQTHVEDLADAINDVRATSWTPLAEAMYNAIGYYTQNAGLMLNDGDFATPTDTTDPVTNYCQENHVLIITEGASTADVNQNVITYVDGFSIKDGDLDNDIDPAVAAAAGKCTDGLQGSTYLDDLTYIAQYAPVNLLYPAGNSQILSADGNLEDKQNITTHIVATGLLGNINAGDDECSPAKLIRDAATNGGTTLMESADSAALESNLLATLNDLRQRASAGSAASVISSARGGEGAIYQAIFWPELKRSDNNAVDWTIAWAGDLHALFIDKYGYMYEDTDGNRTMKPTEDKDNDGVLSTVNEDVDGDGRLDVDEDNNSNGNLDDGEDVDGDGHLDVNEDLDNDGCLDVIENLNGNETLDLGDKRAIIYFDTDANRSKACYNTSIFDSGTCTSSVELSAVNFLWAANDWLAKISNNDYASTNFAVNDIFLNRDVSDYISAAPRRHIFTWIDLDNDGVVDETDVDATNEIRPFVDRDSAGNAVDWTALTTAGTRGIVAKDFAAADNDEVREIVRWVRGADWTTEDINGNSALDAGEDLDGDGNIDVFEDTNGNGILDAGEDVDGDGSLESSPVRRRQIPLADGSSTFITWRLGDIIHSTPMTVAAPSEGYHLLYNDQTYARFVSRYTRRRHVVYFGANDGMMHAANGGFYSEKEKQFCLSPLETDGTCSDASADAPALGAELWAYVPYNLLPHLKCLTAPAYAGGLHKYYVDLRPRIFDVKIFTPETACDNGTTDPACIHPEGWGTIMVGGMRFGGAPMDAQADLGQTSDDRRFISSYFILDITNPEQPPTLLGELTQTLTDSDTDGVPDTPDFADLGYSTVISSMVIMKDKTTEPVSNDWYLILGSGPHGPEAIRGVSDQPPKVSVFYLNDLVDTDNKGVKAMRIPATPPSGSGIPEDATFSLAGYGSGNGFVSDPVTIDFDINPIYEEYKADAVYFGTVEGDFDAASTYWEGGGMLYRLVTKEIDSVSGHSEYGLAVTENVTYPADWHIKPLLDLTAAQPDADSYSVNPKPITASPTVATDGRNFWIYFGTGRFFHPDDKTDDQQQTYYGIKEPMVFTDPATCPTSTREFTWDEVALPSLLPVDDIQVAAAPYPYLATLSCRSGGSCLPAGVDTLQELINYTSGVGDCSTGGNYAGEVDGWYKDFYPYGNRERNLGQATVLGGLLTFTTYQPFNDLCAAEGLAYLYGLYYQTGTSWNQSIFGNDTDYVSDKILLGRGLALTPNLHLGSDDGTGSGPKVFVQTSTGEIKEILQKASPFSVKPGKFKWKEFPGCP